MSGDGSVIAYQSLASNLLCEDTCGPSESDINLLWDMYVYDRASRRTARASGEEREGWMESSRGPSLDQTGRLLTLTSRHPTSLGDEGNDEDLFIVDLPEILDQHQIGDGRVSMDQDCLTVRRHGQARWLERSLDARDHPHPAG